MQIIQLYEEGDIVNIKTINQVGRVNFVRIKNGSSWIRPDLIEYVVSYESGSGRKNSVFVKEDLEYLNR